MTVNEFKMPPNSKSDKKLEQVKALNVVRLHAIQSNQRGYLSDTAINEQVAASLASSGLSRSIGVNHTAVNHSLTGFNAFSEDPSSCALTEDDIYTYLYGDVFWEEGNTQSDQREATVFNY